MLRIAVAAFCLLFGIGVAAQNDASKPADTKKQSTTQPTTPQNSQSDSQSGTKPSSQSSDDPDDLLNSPMTPPSSDKPASEQFPFPEDQEKGSYSSSKDSQGDLTPPRGDSLHPGADIKAPDDVTETKPWNPHEADKDIEVGTYYFKRGNYKAAEARYRDALSWQDNNAEAMYRLGATLQKEGRALEARMYYEHYLKILPKGEFSGEIHKEIEKMEADEKKEPKKPATSPSS